MRKIYKLLAVVYLAAFCNISFGQTIWSEDFSGASGTTPPAGWSNTDVSASGLLWDFENDCSRTINSPMVAPVAIIDSDCFEGSDEETILASPIFDASIYVGSTIFLNFDHYFRGGFGGAFAIEVFDGVAWNAVLSGTTSTTDPASESIDITAACGMSDQAQIRFVWTGSYSWYWILDNIEVTAISCLAPSLVAASNIGLTTADLSWTSGAANFNIEWSTSPFTPGNSESEGSATSATTSYSFTGLTQGTTYYVSVQADCGVVDGVSSWSTPVQFTTTIPGATCEVALPIASLPFSATDNTSGYGDNYGGSPGASGCGTTGSYLGGDDVVYSFTADFDGVVNLSMTPTATWSGVFVYESCANIGVDCYAGAANSGTGIRTFDFNVIDGNTYYIVISTNPTPQSTAYTLTLTQITCPDPSGLTLDNLSSTTADVSWTAGYTETAWNIEWGAPGFTPGTGAQIGADASASEAYSITGLTADTGYDIYVQADCGAVDGTSEWVGPLNVFTGYCSVSTTNTGDYTSAFSTTAAITNVNYTATSQPAGSYSNQIAQNFRAIPGSSINFSHTYVGGSNGVKIWVDWNNNLQFEASEEVFYLANTNATKTGSIAVPPGTVLGDYRMRVRSQFGGTANPPSCGNVAWGSTIDFQLEIVEVPVSPILSQDPSAPTCDLGTEITAAGSPEADVVWYWQETASGSSTDNEYTGPLTVFANGTYFIRAYHTVYDYWADASSVTVSNFPLVADLPPAPVAGANPVCLPGTEITMPTPDAGFEYYWQTIENGTSTANNAATPWEITATGTYYVATFETATNCWSETSSITVTVDTYVPAAPSVTESVFNICVGEVSQEIEAIAPADGTVNVTIGTNVNWTPGTSVLTSNLSLPAGAVVTNASITVNGVTTTGITFLNDLSLSSTGAVNLSSTTLPGAFTATNAGPFTYPVTVNGSGAFTVTLVNAWTSLATAQSILLTVNYSLPASTINWYDAAVAGDLVGSGSPFEAIGSSVMDSPAEAGVYEFYAASQSGACMSEERTLVTINVTPVNVDLVGVDATCNGGNNGTFSITNVDCGLAPFTFSVDGGAFGPIPFDLTVGTYSVVVRDANNDESAVYTISVGQPGVVTGVQTSVISASEIQVNWTAIGTETEWVIEYGPQGFTPGTGMTEIANAIPTVIGGLTSQTTYDFYVRSLCSPGFEGDNSAVASGTTYPSCGNTVYDNGGASGNYLPSSNEVTVICPLTAGDYVQIDFVSFNTEASYDGIYVFDGSDITAPMLASANAAGFGAVTEPGAYWGEDLPGPFFASNEEGCLTIQFLSDPFVQLAGFEYVITCAPIDLTPGEDGEVDVCRLDMTIDLFDVITAGDDFGTWTFPTNPGVLNGSILNVFGLPAGTYEAFYTVTNPFDTTVTVATVNVFPPSSAGNSGVISTCNYGPMNLFDGLSGNVDLGGTWYDPAGNPLTSALVVFNGQIAANYNYYYVTSNGVCPADTAFVEVQLQNCASVIENELQGFEVYPNPTSDVVFVQYTGAPMTADFMLTDAKGAVIFAEKKTISVESAYEMDLSKLERGVYFLNIFGSEGSKVIKVVRN